MFDATGDYRAPFTVFGIIVGIAAVMVLAAKPPGPLPRVSSVAEPTPEVGRS
jgi:hypothetical protein